MNSLDLGLEVSSLDYPNLTDIESESYEIPDLAKDERDSSNLYRLGSLAAINLIINKTLGTGIFSIPSFVYSACGSTSLSLSLWILGALVSFCGLKVYCDLGSALPFSGGERVYLERIFKRPRLLATHVFMSFTVILGSSAPPCVVFGQYTLYALNMEYCEWLVRPIAVIAISIVCLLHSYHPRWTKWLVNILGLSKIFIIAVMIMSGAVYWTFNRDQNKIQPSDKFKTADHSTRLDFYALGTAFLQIMYCFRGYNAVNQVIQDAKNPRKVFSVSSPIAFTIVAISYISINICYFAVLSAEDMKESGVLIAGQFFRVIYGEILGRRILSLVIISSSLGSIAATAYTQARVNQELGNDGILPYRLWWVEASTKTATPGLFLHWAVTVAVITLPPTNELYKFLISLSSYPVSVLSVLLSVGLLRLQISSDPVWKSPMRASKLYIVLFGIANLISLILPWIRPKRALEERGNKYHTGFPYYTYPLSGLAVMLLGAVYFAGKKITRSTLRRGLKLDGLKKVFDRLSLFQDKDKTNY